MKKRWKMNRIGFVNFWLYDEETFDFADGKLLLRGQNGSGKSITTQSFIPFILDGDRTPSRLDPFGSGDRKMEYYFLGEGDDGKDESTGYLFLEFKRDGEDEYRTIGIGQRARRGKSMDFWGFIITDGRRVGYDLSFYKSVGTNKIPYDKREMKAIIGEKNFFTENQSEYKKNVNQYIFGFRKDEQYEQYIKLLVKVRAPKLSKEFKPTKVYEILNDSLQTLTDDDLRAMVDAMEKMDEIQDSLEMLNRAYSDIKSIRNEYIRYNQYMLGKKAQRYIDRKKNYENIKKQLDEQINEKQAIENEYSDKKQRGGEVEEQIKLVFAERNSLLDTDLDDIDRKLEAAISQRAEDAKSEKKWDDKIQDYNARIRKEENNLEQAIKSLEERRQELSELRRELEEEQEIVQWDEHDTYIKLTGEEKSDRIDEILKSIEALKKLIEGCRKTIEQYSKLEKQYDELAFKLETTEKDKKNKELELERAQSCVLESIDSWITGLFDNKDKAKEWKPDKETLKKAEQLAKQYKSVDDAGRLQELLRVDYERQRQALIDIRGYSQNNKKLKEAELNKAQAELAMVKNKEELEPVRSEAAKLTRQALENAGIKALPFYKTVEFADNMKAEECARLEAQLERMGILDALVVADGDINRIRMEYPEFIDTIICVQEKGNSDFSRLIVSEDIDGSLQEQVARILSNIYDDNDNQYMCAAIGNEGIFHQGILAGRADKSGDAEYIGVLARKKRKEQKIRELGESIENLSKEVKQLELDIAGISGQLTILSEEYQNIPNFGGINKALSDEEKCAMELQHLNIKCEELHKEEQLLLDSKNRQYQLVIKECRQLPYGRTAQAYDEAESALDEYCDTWRTVKDTIISINIQTDSRIYTEQQLERDRDEMDNAFAEKRNYSTRIKQLDIQIKQYEAYLNSPEIKEKSRRLKELKDRLDELNTENEQIKLRLAKLEERIDAICRREPQIKNELETAAAQELQCRNYFDEELSLKLVIDGTGKTFYDCALQAVGLIRDLDRNREASELLQSLYNVFQKHNASLSAYGTTLEECFDTENDAGDNVLRKRVRVASMWNGKKVFLEEFYNILKNQIEETQLLIQQRDRELFEDILSQTISRQLTDRIAESRRWVADMSQLMKEMDTSMGLSFSLDWKPCKAENDAELDTSELETILLRDRSLLTVEDIEKVASHFRSKIRMEKQRIEDNGGGINYMDLVRDALDYRRWFEFQMFYRRGGENKRPLTNAAFNRFSGGEKAMAMYVPLFAAVNAQYKKAENEDHPRMVALDEAFAGVDDKNISSMFELVHKLDFDYIMNSQALWGCFDTVRQLKIAELLRPQNSQVVTVIHYTWNGHERLLDEQ